jgi:hypothetical protein
MRGATARQEAARRATALAMEAWARGAKCLPGARFEGILSAMDGSRDRSPSSPAGVGAAMSRLGGILLALAAAATSAAGDPPSAPPAADTESIIFAAKPTLPAPEKTAPPAPRPAASAIDAEITRGLPAFREPGGDVAPVTPPETDRPRNQIPRLPATLLPKYVVRESRLPVFRILDLYTPKGLTELGFQEHPGLRFGNFFNLNAQVAYETIVQEQLRAERDELMDMARTMSIDGDHEDERLMQEALVEQAFLSTETARK